MGKADDVPYGILRSFLTPFFYSRSRFLFATQQQRLTHLKRRGRGQRHRQWGGAEAAEVDSPLRAILGLVHPGGDSGCSAYERERGEPDPEPEPPVPASVRRRAASRGGRTLPTLGHSPNLRGQGAWQAGQAGRQAGRAAEFLRSVFFFLKERE